MDKIDKEINKLTVKEKKIIAEIIAQIDFGNFYNLDFKKLKGRTNIFRVRKGKIRIIFYKLGDKINILAIERRPSKLYKKL